MSQTITVELNDETYASLARQAEVAGQTPAERLRAIAEREATATNGAGGPPPGDSIRARIERYYPGVFGPPDTRSDAEKRAAAEAFRRLIGAYRSGRPGADNDLIDADLAREYANNHEFE
ncbi:MAG TPA: hypothetical protein VH120_18610 [Gemmataceae bacterium]|nr:hypothetical protein [Gemmataceae bacterium]